MRDGIVVLARLVVGVALMTGASAGICSPIRPDAAPRPSANLILVDDEMHDAPDGEDWRLQAESFAPVGPDRDELRLRVKVRPNRAMGRMSLSF